MPSIKMQKWHVDGVEVDPDNPTAGEGDEVIEEAVKVLRSALASLATHNVVIAHEIANLGIPIFTRDIPTMAVTIGGDGIVRLLINPEFVVDVGEKTTAFGLAHEVDHVVLAHLVPDEALGFDEAGTLAKEVVINHRVTKMLPVNGVPSRDGTPLVVDPKEIYQKYARAKKNKGEQPVDFSEFVDNDLACASYIREIPTPPKSKGAVCIRAAGTPIPGTGDPNRGDGDEAGDGHDHSNGPLTGVDPEQAGKLVDDVLGQVMTRALKGDKSCKEVLLDLGHRLGEDHPLWGTLGLGALRGETPPPVEVSFWEQYLYGALTSILVPGCRLVYPKKLIGFEDLYEEHGFRLPFQPVGDERQTKLGIAVDTSGSMPTDVIRRVAALTGKIPNCKAVWCAFDAEVHPFEPGEPLRGGGGTDFDVVREWAEKEHDDEPLDCVLVLTDGHAPAITPAEPDKWVWLITPNGSMWPADKGMSCVIVDLPG